MASTDKSLLASENHGSPAVAATPKPGDFTGKGVVAAREEKGPVNLPGAKPGSSAGAEPNAHGENIREDKRPVGTEQAPPKEVNREVHPPAADVKPHTEIKPTPPPPAVHTQPAPHVARTPKPPPPPLPAHPAPTPNAKDKNKKPPQ